MIFLLFFINKLQEYGYITHFICQICHWINLIFLLPLNTLNTNFVTSSPEGISSHNFAFSPSVTNRHLKTEFRFLVNEKSCSECFQCIMITHASIPVQCLTCPRSVPSSLPSVLSLDFIFSGRSFSPNPTETEPSTLDLCTAMYTLAQNCQNLSPMLDFKISELYSFTNISLLA